MPSSLLRGALFGAAALALAATPAQAATELLGSAGPTLDVSSDGRYILLPTAVLDRTTGTSLPVGDGIPVALADRAPRVLVDTVSGLVVRDLAAGTERAADVDVDGSQASIALGARAVLINDGRTVLFTAKGTTPRVIERDLETETSTVRLSGAKLLDASEDGQVVTFDRDLEPATRPVGAAAFPDAITSIPGNAVGYQLRGQGARIVEVSSAKETFTPFFDTGACSERRARVTASTRPYDLQISQGGSGQYALYLTRVAASGSEVTQGGHTVIDRVDATSTTLLADAGNPSVDVRLSVDPVSGAYTLIHTTHGGSPRWNTATLVAQDGAARRLGVLPITGPGGTFDASSFTTIAVPFNAGAGAVYRATPNTADQQLARPGIYVSDEAPPGPSAATPWLTLPRAADVADSAALRPSVTWADCGPVLAPATIADYAALTLRTTGNSAGSVGVTLAPAGKAKAKSVTATVSWLGLPFFARRATTDATIKLPGIPVGIGGFKLTLVAALDNGQTVRSGTTLRRTR